jgi:tetratricopeptide (TPR) repeat protein
MIHSEQNSAVRISHQLSDIQKAVEGKEYLVALTKIREVQSSSQLDDMSFEAGEFYRLSAKTFYHLGSYQEALEAGQESISIFIRLHDELKIAESQFVLGLAYIGTGNLKSAETEMRDALTAHRRARDFRGAIGCLSRLANIEFIKGNYFKSIEYLQDALAWANETTGGHERASLCGNLGVMFLMIGRWHEAEKNLLLNIELNRQAGNEINLCKGLLSLGYIYFVKRKFSIAKDTYAESFSLIQKNNCVRELAIYHEYSGELCFVQGNYQQAYEHYMKGIEIGEKIAPNSGIISQTYRLLADLQVAKKEYDQAFSSCQRALEVSISLGERIEEAACYCILGQIYAAKGDKQKAKEYFSKSLSIFEDIKAKYELAKAYLEAGKSDCFDQYERLKFLGRAEDIFKELKSKYHIASVNFALSHLFFENRECEKSELFLRDAEKVFRELKEEKDFDLVQEFKKKIGKFTGTINTIDPERRYTFSDIITQNKEMLDILEKAQQIKDTDMTVLIEGETGTGKDLLAKCIHFESKRKDKRFVVVSCAAVPEALLESELFGYKKGAFTGASFDKKGLLEEADQGTLFLNEVADLPLLIQVKLLGVIENKELTRLGETKSRKIDFRIIAASNKELEEEVKAKRFRNDFYYRLKVIRFVLPPLKERREDIPLLIRHFSAFNSDKGNVELGNDVLEAPVHYT